MGKTETLHWMKMMQKTFTSYPELNTESVVIYNFVKSAYKSAIQGGTQEDLLHKISLEYMSKCDLNCAMFALSSVMSETNK